MSKYYFFSYFVHIFYPLIAIILNVFLQIVLIRIIKIGYFKSILIGFFIGLIIIIFFEIIFIFYNNFIFSYLFINISNYFLFSFAYFAILSTGKTSLRLRILTEIFNKSNGLKLYEIYEKYNSDEIIQTRIDRLINNNQIKKINNRYYSVFSSTLFIGFILDIPKFFLFGRKKCLNKFLNKNK